MTLQLTHRNEFPELIDHLGYKIGAEVGVGQGRFSNHLMQAGFTKFYMIDNFMVHKPDDVCHGFRADALQVVEARQPVAVLIEKLSNDAAPDFPDGSFDFVYIDTMHEDPYAHEDIRTWWPKVRSGGMLAGHDYVPCSMTPKYPYGVMLAVEELVASLGIPVWVTGATAPVYVERLRAALDGLAAEASGNLGIWAENIPSWYAIKP